jgi:hypothetical protein
MVTELVITYKGDKDGYRVVSKKDPEKFRPNPTVNKGNSVRWHAPEDKAACIAILAESPFIRDGKPVTHEFLEIPKGGKSEEFQIAGDAKGEYEYAVLVREAARDYTYVRGAASPPGIVVGG